MAPLSRLRAAALLVVAVVVTGVLGTATRGIYVV